jgi:hypothetical protein
MTTEFPEATKGAALLGEHFLGSALQVEPRLRGGIRCDLWSSVINDTNNGYEHNL